MKTSSVEYLGNLRTRSTHLRSGEKIITDAPIDNHGRGEAFSPTDLAATSLANCMLTIMGIAANNHGINMDGARAEVMKIMKDNPRRIGQIIIDVHMPGNEYSAKEKAILEHAGRTCPVAKSLHPDLEQTIHFHW
jgi:uncharacterized OsmC-like protein